MSSESTKSDNEAFHLFILKSHTGSMKAPIQFLHHRNWIVESAINIREALSYIIQKQPQFVLIAADHPNRKVRILPRLLIQAFPVQVIAFMEKSTVAARQLLSEMGVEHQIFPPTSGPAIERMILKIKKEQEEKPSHHKNLSHIATGDGSKSDSDVRVFSSGTHLDNSAIGISGSIQQAKDILQQFLSADDDHEIDPSVEQSGTQKVGSQIYIDKGKKYEGGIGGIITNDEYASDWQAQSDPASTSASRAHTSNPTSAETDTGPKGETPIEGERTQAAPPTHKELSQKLKFHYNKRQQAHSDGPDSIIVRGTEQAIDESVSISSSHENVEEVNSTSNAACILVESPRFNGYLVAALGKNKKVDPQFIDTVKTRLFSFLKAHGENPKEIDNESMQIKLQEVEFESWAIEQAEFLKKSVHGSDEVAMAFFPTQTTKLNLEESVSSQMLKMTIDDLKEDAPVEFDLYIYMPENNKYLLYTPEGRPFLKQQKSRLKEKGISHMHLRKEAGSNVKKYRAQNFLNEKIEQFKKAAAKTQ